MSLSFNTTLRSGWLTDLIAAIDAGAGAGILAFYGGTKKSFGTDPDVSTPLIAQIALADPSGSEASQTLTFDTTPTLEDSEADADGDITWFRVYSSADGSTISEANKVFQGDVSDNDGSGDIKLVTVTVVTGQPVQISSWTVAAPGA